MKVSLMRGNTKIEIREEKRRERKKEYNPLKSRIVGLNTNMVKVSDAIPETITEVQSSLLQPRQEVIRSTFLSPEEPTAQQFKNEAVDKTMEALGVTSEEVEKPVKVNTEKIVDSYNETMETNNPITITAEELQNAMLGGNEEPEDSLANQINEVNLSEDLEEEKVQEDLNDKYADEYEHVQGGLEKICKTNKKDLSLY